jgi:Agrobacterium tumefaciens protein Atu4866
MYLINKHLVVIAAIAIAIIPAECSRVKQITMQNNQSIEESKAYLGMWVTADCYIRHELLPGNRYDEARGNRKSAYRGSYKVTGNHIDYKDDTGFTADGDFRDGILYHAGMVLYKEIK